MGKLNKTTNWKDALKVKVASIDTKKFDIEITETILKNNGWEQCESTDLRPGWCPPNRDWVYNEEKGDWEPDLCDFDECFIWFRGSKEAWCYTFNFGTYIYDIKSIGELEIILAREGFDYSFDI